MKTIELRWRWVAPVLLLATVAIGVPRSAQADEDAGWASAYGDRGMIFVLADRADNPDPKLRADALHQLMSFHDELSVGAVARFLNDKDPGLRHEALDYLGARRSRGAVVYLGSAFQHPDVTMRRDAIAWLQAQAHSDYRGEVAVALLPFLGDPARGVRLQALAAVGETGHASIVPQVARLYDVPDPELRLAAVSTLNRVWDKAAAEALVPFVEDGDARVRKATYQGLAQFGGRTGFDLLVNRGLHDTDREVRLQVIESVAELRLGASIDTLQARFKVADLDEQKLVVAALATIGTADAQVALRELNAAGSLIEQTIVARVWSETRDQIAAEHAAMAEILNRETENGLTRVQVSIDPTYGIWEP